MILTLIGMPGCGKSCMGRAISRKLGMKNIDGDKLIEHRLGKKLYQIIDEVGLDGFKEIERKTLLSINEDNVVVSPGGSAVYYPDVMEHFKRIGKIIYLYCSYDVIEKRLGDFSKRGVVLRPDQTLRDLYNERVELYKKYADITVDCSGDAYPKYQGRVLSAIKYVKEYI
ncbi:MAG: shikimate kinase [Clostridia bacterium]|nr:shikimate kinase [Clostridia bacterium]